MHLVEILLPLNDNNDRQFDAKIYRALRQELTNMFGGVTAFNRAPALGESKDGGDVVQDSIVIFEVMVDDVDHSCWRHYRETLEGVFDQDEIAIRALPMEKI